ncbi:MAG: 4-hydroxybenzoate octaprenyltransferase [Alphaproteobacteria bacterium]|nr:4-hydroxybenzoate octaprenyltransferase [Alphaproteobacteria bacterium]MBP7758104.1 4-hydroxybenzoate octaprenyltransferase [Alphaproteobacteria bacterium]MBP7761463.1 4-hydroxybenzoate octaprenyltransferase [Alphaproteobacteria bacterium]
MTDTLNTNTHTDIKRLPWIEERLPEKLRPFAYLARLDRPIGIWLLLLPGWWGVLLGSGGLFGMSLYSWFLIGLFGIGAVLMRAAGCVINDLWDRDLDKQVERTKNRPLAAGTVSRSQALVLLAGLLSISLVILLTMNRLTIVLGVLTIPLIVAYPLMKRVTWWPQAFLGITFNFGALMGYTAITGTLSFSCVFLYLAGICWTLGYDTIYAHQDKEDDALAGMKSTALLFGENSPKWVKRFYELTALFLVLAVLISSGSLWTSLLILAACSHLLWQITEWKSEDPASSLHIFRSNRDFGLLILLALLFGA